MVKMSEKIFETLPVSLEHLSLGNGMPGNFGCLPINVLGPAVTSKDENSTKNLVGLVDVTKTTLKLQQNNIQATHVVNGFKMTKFGPRRDIIKFSQRCR